jgi:hypothetical protein
VKTKEELYNKIVDITHQTGQGLSGLIEMKIGSTLFNELIDDGLIRRKKYPSSFGNPLAMTFYCLTTGYAAEFDDEEPNALTFIREYLGLEHDIIPSVKITLGEMLREEESAWITWKNSNLTNKSRKDFDDACKTYQDKYYDWLKKNQHQINLMMKVEHISTLRTLTTDEVNFINNLDWFNEKLSIEELITKFTLIRDNKKELKQINNQLLNLYNTDKIKYKDDIKKSNSEIKKIDSENKLIKYLITHLENGISINELMN